MAAPYSYQCIGNKSHHHQLITAMERVILPMPKRQLDRIFTGVEPELFVVPTNIYIYLYIYTSSEIESAFSSKVKWPLDHHPKVNPTLHCWD